MLLSELIKQLQGELDKQGDMLVYTNGEFGTTQPIKITRDYITTGPAKIELDEELLEFAVENGDVTPDTTVCYIGGY